MKKIKDSNCKSGYLFKFLTDSNKWQFHTPDAAWEGNLLEIWQLMVFEYDISNSDIRYSALHMKRSDDNVAHFGILGNLIFTCKK